MSTGISEAKFAELKKLPLVVAPGTGGEACLARCNLTFSEVIKLTNRLALEHLHAQQLRVLQACRGVMPPPACNL